MYSRAFVDFLIMSANSNLVRNGCCIHLVLVGRCDRELASSTSSENHIWCAKLLLCPIARNVKSPFLLLCVIAARQDGGRKPNVLKKKFSFVQRPDR